MIVLGLETSCDETAVGIVTDEGDGTQRILADVVATQFTEHKPYGGVVPEIAARAHLDKIDDVLREALAQADLQLEQIDAIAATCGPGLIGGVMVGAMMGKALAAVSRKPFIAINHLEAHALTARLTQDVAFPYLLLLLSGGHAQILYVQGIGNYRCLGATRDDAVGECFDKSAKLLGLGYPGGPLIEKAAQSGNPKAFALPLPMVGRDGCDFSFSGLKTAVRLAVEAAPKPHTNALIADMAASLQAAITEVLVDRTKNALKMVGEKNDPPPTALVIGGGVAANQAIRDALTKLAQRQDLDLFAPPIHLCTDNGVMIAWAGLERFRLGLHDGLDAKARPRWPLEELNSNSKSAV